jgi:hypothetical protein
MQEGILNLYGLDDQKLNGIFGRPVSYMVAGQWIAATHNARQIKESWNVPDS